MLGPGSPHGDSHQFLSSAPLLNNLAVTFPPSSFIFPINFFFFLLAVSKGDNVSAFVTEGQNWAGGLLKPTPLWPVSSVLCSPVCGRGGAAPAAAGGAKKGEGAGSPGLPSGSGTWVRQAGWILSWGSGSRQNSFRGPRVGSRIGRVPTVL